ncbi:MAG: transglycosylase domain-containing protein [Marmoricola sp.]
MSGTRRADGPNKGNGARKPGGRPPAKRGIVKQVFAIGQPNDWRTWLQRLLVVCIVFVLVCVGAFFVAYEATTIPDPNAAFQTQSTYVYYANGKSQLGTFATQNRQSVPLTDVAQPMQDATVAAEDRTFWTNKGVDLKSIFRSVFNNAQGGATQGGSTITMQYVKILYLNQSQTITRKIKQIFLALKIQQKESKQQVLEGYLNTVYFGRGAYGVQAAAEAYFGVPASKLNAAQSAVLAAEINEPSYLDPTGTAAQRSALLGRYQYVLDGMVSMGTLDSTVKAKIYSRLPKVRSQRSVNVFGGQKGFALEMVKAQLMKLGFTEAQIYGSGLRVTTTLTQKAMNAAADGVAANKPGGLNQLHVGTASVNVRTGALLGFYAGQDYLKGQFNWATAPNPPGSVFKVPALAAALSNGWSLKNTFDGNSPLMIHGTKIQNEGEASGIANGTSYGSRVSLLQGLIQSINTVYVDMTNSTPDGPNKVKDMLVKMGVPANAPGLTYAGGNGQRIAPTTIALGSASVSPLDIANAYSTIANGGMAHPWYVVQKVTDSNGKVLWQHHDHQSRAMSSQVAADVSYAMQQVVKNPQGTGGNALGLGRPDAGKTGTATGLNNQHVITSWFAGFTPQVATAVIYLRTNPKNGSYLPLDGYMPSYFGADYPTRTWTSVMRAIMAGLPVEQFPPPGNVKASNLSPNHAAFSPRPTPTSRPTPTAKPKPTPKPTPVPSPSPSPSNVPPPPPSPSATCTALNGQPYSC